MAHFVTAAPGGQGAVREVIELLLKAQGRWSEILKHYEARVCRGDRYELRIEYPSTRRRLDFVSLGALVHRLDPGIIPFRKATECQIHVSGGEFNCAANLSDCFGMTDRHCDAPWWTIPSAT